jgi:hypothetical protein
MFRKKRKTMLTATARVSRKRERLEIMCPSCVVFEKIGEPQNSCHLDFRNCTISTDVSPIAAWLWRREDSHGDADGHILDKEVVLHGGSNRKFSVLWSKEGEGLYVRCVRILGEGKS